MKPAFRRHIPLWAIMITAVLMADVLRAGPAMAKDDGSSGMNGTYLTERDSRRYGSLGISFVNFEAVGVPGGFAQAAGLTLTAGWRLSGIVSLEWGLNWIPVCAPYLLPLPLTWMPDERGIYLNLGAGVRLNLVDHDLHEIVPWVSYWRTGHALLGDYSIGSRGNTLALGVEGSSRGKSNWQIAFRVHSFTGGLEITEGVNTVKYRDTEIRAVELVIQIRGS